MKQEGAKASTHRSLERGLALLESVAASARPVSLAESARRTGLHRSTAHHLLQTLVSLGYLRQSAETRAYELSAKPFQLTGQTWSAEQLAAIGQPFLAEATRRGGEGSSLAAYRDGTVTVVAKREHDGPVRVVQDVGARRPLHCTAVAKAILPWLPKPELEGLLARIRFVRLTPKTIVTRVAFEAELRRIRAAGYALDDEEHVEGIRCIAMPVFGHTGEVLASLCTLGPKSRMSYQRLRELRAPLAELAQQMSKRLGYHG
jgi:DNA-binding IclR family transcriptional regulator